MKNKLVIITTSEGQKTQSKNMDNRYIEARERNARRLYHALLRSATEVELIYQERDGHRSYSAEIIIS